MIDVTKIYVPASIKDEEVGRNYIVNEINKYIHKFRNPFTRYILGVGGPESIFRTLNLPKMPKRELDKAVLWEGNKRTPFNIESACYGYHSFDKVSSDGNKTVAVSFIAVSRKEIDRLFNLIEPLNLKIDAIYLEQEAIGCMLPHIAGFEDDKTFSLITIKYWVSVVTPLKKKLRKHIVSLHVNIILT